MSFSILFFLFLVLVLSLDAFAAGLSYGLDRVRIPFRSGILIAGSSGLMLTLSLLCGNYLLNCIPPILAKAVSFLVLFCLGIYKLLPSLSLPSSKSASRKPEHISRQINQSDPSILSLKEAALVSLAFSADNVCAGLGTGTGGLSPYMILFSATIIHLLVIYLGLSLGRFLSGKKADSLSCLGSVILLVLAFLRLF